MTFQLVCWVSFLGMLYGFPRPTCPYLDIELSRSIHTLHSITTEQLKLTVSWCSRSCTGWEVRGNVLSLTSHLQWLGLRCKKGMERSDGNLGAAVRGGMFSVVSWHCRKSTQVLWLFSVQVCLQVVTASEQPETKAKMASIHHFIV